MAMKYNASSMLIWLSVGDRLAAKVIQQSIYRLLLSNVEALRFSKLKQINVKSGPYTNEQTIPYFDKHYEVVVNRFIRIFGNHE